MELHLEGRQVSYRIDRYELAIITINLAFWMIAIALRWWHQ
jgi:hypothetical protein